MPSTGAEAEDLPLISQLAGGRTASTATFCGPEGRTERSGADLLDRAARLGAGLRDQGVCAGDRVVSLFPNSEDSVTTQLATWMLGAVLVPIVPTTGAAELEIIVRDARPAAIVTRDRWRRHGYAAYVDALPPGLRPPVIVLAGAVTPGAVSMEELLERPPLPLADWVPAPHSDVHLLIYTSGSTGVPKGVQHTGSSILGETDMSYRVYWSDEDVYLQAAGSGHVGSVMYPVRMLRDGIRTFVLEAWDAALAADLVATERVSSLPAVPLYLSTLIEQGDREGLDLSSIASSYVGGAPVMPRLIEACADRGIVAQRTYGSSEQPTVSATRPDDPLALRMVSEGHPLGDNEVRVVDLNDRDLPPGSAGDLLIRGSELFSGYTNVPMRETFTNDGWFRTGDIAVLDTNGRLQVVDRRKNIIIRGGENFSSSEIEAAVAEHPSVRDVAVIGTPDERYGERVCAVVVTEDGANLDIADLIVHFDALGLSRQKVPERLRVVDELPRTASGKVARPQLRMLAGVGE